MGALNGRATQPAALSGKGLYDGLWKGLAIDAATPGAMAAYVAVQRHVKAHRSIGQAADEADRFDIVANAAADTAAKRMATRRQVQGAVHAFQKAAALHVATARALARMLALWPPIRETYGELPPPPPHGRRDVAETLVVAHDWQQVSGGWQCASCLRLARCLTEAQGDCEGASHLLRVARAEHAHVLWAALAASGGAVVFCALCGAYAAGRRRRLAARCPGRPPTAALAAQRARIWGNPSRHPAARSNVLLVGEPWPIGQAVGDIGAARSAYRRDAAPRVRRGSSTIVTVPPAVAPSGDVVAARGAPVRARASSASKQSEPCAKRCRTDEVTGAPPLGLSPAFNQGSGVKRPRPALVQSDLVRPPEEWLPPAAEPRGSTLRRRYGR